MVLKYYTTLICLDYMSKSVYSFKRTPLTGKEKINTSEEHQNMFQISIFTAREAATHLKQVKCSYFDSGLLTCLLQRVFEFKGL